MIFPVQGPVVDRRLGLRKALMPRSPTAQPTRTAMSWVTVGAFDVLETNQQVPNCGGNCIGVCTPRHVRKDFGAEKIVSISDQHAICQFRSNPEAGPDIVQIGVRGTLATHRDGAYDAQTTGEVRLQSGHHHLPNNLKSSLPKQPPSEPITSFVWVQAAHQSLHHFVAKADWSDDAVLGVVRAQVLAALERQGPIRAWIVDDTHRGQVRLRVLRRQRPMVQGVRQRELGIR